MDGTREQWVGVQRKSLLLSLSETLCINRYRTEIAAARRADDINNDRDLDWPSSHFRATFSRDEESEEEAFEVLILLRPEVDRYQLLDSSAEQGEEDEEAEMAKNRRLDAKEDLRIALGGDGVASRTVNCLSRELDLYSLPDLVALYEKLGRGAFVRKIRGVRNMGGVCVQRILGKVEEAGR